MEMEERGRSQAELEATSASIDRIQKRGAESEEAGARILASLQAQGASIKKQRGDIDEINVTFRAGKEFCLYCDSV